MTNALAELPQLAGTLNRQAGIQALAQAAQDTKSRKLPLAVLTLDVDHFKPFQDEAGDTQAAAALTRLVEVLQQTLPAGTTITHLGSDEFFVLLPRQRSGRGPVLGGNAARRGRERPGRHRRRAAPDHHAGRRRQPGRRAVGPPDPAGLADMRMTFAKRRLTPHHNLVWAGTLPSDCMPAGHRSGAWPSL